VLFIIYLLQKVLVDNQLLNASLFIKKDLTRKNAIVEYLDYQIPVTQLKGPKRNGDMQAAERD